MDGKRRRVSPRTFASIATNAFTRHSAIARQLKFMASETEAEAYEMTTQLKGKILREGGHQTVHKQLIDESRPRQPSEGAGGPTETTP